MSDAIGGHYHSANGLDVHGLRKKIGDVDMVYEATGASKLSFSVLEMLGPNAIYVFTGVPGRNAPVEIDRITSYNVCYTKLLRMHWNRPASVPRLAAVSRLTGLNSGGW